MFRRLNRKSKHLAASLVLIFIVMVYYQSGILNRNSADQLQSEIDILQRRVYHLQLELTKCQRDKLRNCEIRNQAVNEPSFPSTYRPEYETQRRLLGFHLDELRNFLLAKFKVQENHQTMVTSLDLSDISNRMNRIIAIYRNISTVDGMEHARQEESLRIRDNINQHLTQYQLDPNGKMIECDLTKSCGFACQMHHLLYCSTFAYHTSRRLILNTWMWSYGKSAFNHLFVELPSPDNVYANQQHNHDNNSVEVVNAIKRKYKANSVQWRGEFASRIIHLPIIDGINPRTKFLPQAVPRRLIDETNILSLHGNPFVLFVGHLARQLLRPRTEIERMIDSMKTSSRFESPIVGLHIRRTDKINTEAAYHSVDEYMRHTIDYFEIEQIRRKQAILNRKVFVASDDPNAFEELRSKYPDYTFLYNTSSASSAAVTSRYSELSAIHVSVDVFLLAECDFLVCTFSSQICRLAYELMQTRYTDASWRFKSLDDIYYFGGQLAHDYIAVEDHDPLNADELGFRKGDVIGIAGNHWNGFCFGTNRRTNDRNLFPCYKTMDKVIVAWI